MNKFSIILPVRNGGNYVKECVNSILSQSYPGLHLHVLDNASTDGTLEWVGSLQDSRVIVIPAEKPLTIEENWGRIVSIEKNEFMTMIGHDDILDHHYLDEMNDLVSRHPHASLYQCHYNYIGAAGNLLRPCMPMDEVQRAHEFLACQMARTIESTGTGYLMRSADYDACGGMPLQFPNLIFADYALWMKLMLPAYKATSARFCFSYRLHQNVSRTTNGMQYQDAFGTYIAFIKTLMQDNAAIHEVVTRYGKDMLLYFCESLSHRLLKTPMQNRSLTVSGFIDKCRTYAAQIIPGQNFNPNEKFRINIARQLDQSGVGRKAFQVIKKLIS
jgi:glycosyltransferase involved in cell wall biosynthesis